MTKELVIISGKGGTGKTSLVAAFAALAQNKVMVDCDVDAADLHLILNPQIEITTEFYSGKTAEINPEICVKCGRCIEVCRFNAVSEDFVVDGIKCEGCGTCFYQCPVNAIKFEQVKSGDWFESNTRFGKLIHARLGVAEENSGKLVSQIRNHSRLIAKQNNNDLIIVDGSPGIGCPVIASISGAHLVVIVTEPTLSGFHDAERVLELTKHFKIPASICINKYDLNLELTKQIENFCREKNIEIVGKIPYSKIFTQAMIKEQNIIEYEPDGEVSNKIKNMWHKIENKLI
ncbi:MAG TPA: (4Fe-4S)-binding protein [Cyanobacteria bacterium UBA9971]|nr:(4Fe-4S)-binding protein [Cyanobacteria bacterium UBA9971]